MLTTNQRMGRDQKQLRPQGQQMRQQAKDLQPQRAAQANPPQGVQQAPRVPATKGARTTPVFQAGKPMQAAPSQVPSQQAAPQGLAPGAGGPQATQGGGAQGGLSQQNQPGGIQFTPGGVGTVQQPPPAAGATPSPAQFDWSSLAGTEGNWLLGGGRTGAGPMGPGGGTYTPDPTQPGPSDTPPLVYDDRTYQQMIQDLLMQQLMGGGPDTAAQEAMIMEAMNAQVGQGVADARANMGGGGFAVGGALGALEGDIRREGAMGANQQIMDLRGAEQDRWMDQVMGLTGALQSERELGIYETAFERALRLLEEDGGGGSTGGGGGTNPISEGFQEGGIQGAIQGGFAGANQATIETLIGKSPDGTTYSPVFSGTSGSIQEIKPAGMGYVWVVWNDNGTLRSSPMSADDAAALQGGG